jgi:hypothetical protein
MMMMICFGFIICDSKNFLLSSSQAQQVTEQVTTTMDFHWFEKLFGFQERGYEDTKSHFYVAEDKLFSRANEKSWNIGSFTTPSLAELREKVKASSSAGELSSNVCQNKALSSTTTVDIVVGDIIKLHQDSQYANATIQVASQFNALEMPGPSVTPEKGITDYVYDRTQGPACSLSAAAATVYRNYFVPFPDSEQQGQTANRQLNGLADVGNVLSQATGIPIQSLWKMKNGYALCYKESLDAIGKYLNNASEEQKDVIRRALRVAIHSDVQVTISSLSSSPPPPQPLRPQLVTQVFCSALPVAYSLLAPRAWEPFARLILEGAYEATLLAAVARAHAGTSNKVLLTLVGGGAFGNEMEWILDAIQRAVEIVRNAGLHIEIVSYSKPSYELIEFVQRFQSCKSATFSCGG